jgi:hypothetical protein
MAGAYTWDDFPAAGTSDFEENARAALSTNKDNCASMDEEIYNARGGEANIDTRLDGMDTRMTDIEAGTNLDDESVEEKHLDMNNAPADGKTVSYNATAGKMEWITPGSAEDTGEVRMAAGESPEYLEDQIDAATIQNVSGTLKATPPVNVIAWF